MRIRGLNFVERHPLLHQVLHTVADDGHHVAILDDVELIADTAMTWNQSADARLLT